MKVEKRLTATLKEKETADVLIADSLNNLGMI